MKDLASWWQRGIAAVVALVGASLLAACSTDEAITTVEETYAADRVVVDDFIGTLIVESTPAGGEVGIQLEASVAHVDLLPIELVDGALTIVWLGEPDRPRRWYEFWRGRWMADLNALDRYPTIVLSVPSDIELEFDNLIGRWEIEDREARVSLGLERGSGTIGRVPSAAIEIAGDAEFDIGPVANMLAVNVAGSGTLRAMTAGSADLSVAGSGDVVIGDIAGLVDINVSGSGHVTAGGAGHVEAAVSGSGSISLGAATGGLTAVVQGSGSIAAGMVEGAFAASVAGSGSIVVDDGIGAPFSASISGSGGIRFGGTAVDPSVRISGSGGLVIGTLEGELDATTAGAGNVQVLQRIER